MERSLLLSILIFISSQIYSQEREPRYVVGVETGTIFRSIKNNFGYKWNYSYGFNFSYPISKFSIGLGIIQTNYGKNYFKDFTEESFVPGRTDDSEYFRKEFYLNYIVLSNRIQYRLPCNCAFLHGGFNVEILSWIGEKLIEDRIRTTSEQPYRLRDKLDLKRVNSSIEFGFGVKMHINEMLRIYMNPIYTIAEIPSVEENEYYSDRYHYLRMTFGLQMGIR
jgi:hypothetical protein